MTREQQTIARNALQQFPDSAIARTIWGFDPGMAAALGLSAFAILTWLAR